MGMLSNKQAQGDKAIDGAKAPAPRERYIIGTSECYFEVAQYLTGKLTPEKVKALFSNEAMTIEETEGKSLKVMFRTANEVKFIGFVTAGDASIELDAQDVDKIMDHASNEPIVKAISADELVALF